MQPNRLKLKEILDIYNVLPIRLRLAGVLNIVLIAAATSFQSLLVLTIGPFLKIFEEEVILDANSIYRTISTLSDGWLTEKESICILFIAIALISMFTVDYIDEW